MVGNLKIELPTIGFKEAHFIPLTWFNDNSMHDVLSIRRNLNIWRDLGSSANDDVCNVYFTIEGLFASLVIINYDIKILFVMCLDWERIGNIDIPHLVGK